MVSHASFPLLILQENVLVNSISGLFCCPQAPDWHLQAAALVQEADRAVPSEAPLQPSSMDLLDPVLAPLRTEGGADVARSQLAASLCQVFGFEAVLLTDPPR